MYKLFYNPCVSTEQLKPLLTLDACLEGANNGNHSYRTKLVRLNWMIQDLKYNSIQKPFLVDKDFKIITGDTRYMATQFHANIQHVPCLMSADTCNESGWVDIQDKKELGELLNILPQDIVTNWNWQDKLLDWIEFAYSHTSNHMHDEQQRARMITNYLHAHPQAVFDHDWLLCKIDWSLYDH